MVADRAASHEAPGRGVTPAPGVAIVLALVACSTPEPPPPDLIVTFAPEVEAAAIHWAPPMRSAAADPEGLSRASALLAQARKSASAGRHAEAADAYERAMETSDALADWAAVFAAAARAEQGDVSGVERLLASVPPDLRDTKGWSAEVRALNVAGRSDDALSRVREAIGRAPDEEARTSAELALARSLLLGGDTATARRVLVALLRRDGTARTNRAAADLLESVGPPDGDAYRVLAGHLGTRGDIDRLARLHTAMGRAPGVGRSDLEAVNLERAVVVASRTADDGAVKRLGDLAAQTTEPDLRSRAWLAAGRVRLRQGRNADAAKLLTRSVDSAPASPWAQEALLLLADLDQDRGARATARDRFARAVAIDPTSEWGAEAAIRLGTLLYQEGDDLGAAAVFDAYREAHPEGWRSQQANFWAGAAYLRLGEQALAAARWTEAEGADPVAYYGMRARRGLGSATETVAVEPGPPPSTDDENVVAGGLARVEALRSSGHGDAANVEERRLRRLLATREGGLHTLAEAYHARGRTIEAVRVGREARRQAGRWDARALRIVFPLPYREQILAQAGERGVDPYLMAALIRQESLFQPEAVSPAGAVGLMQLLPGTARSLAGAAGLRRVETSTLKQPDVNLRLGSVYLASLLRTHGDRVEEALMAYNAGQGRLARWRSFPEYGDPDLFLERIPYRETRDYVRIIRESAGIYAWLYGGDEAPAGVTAE